MEESRVLDAAEAVQRYRIRIHDFFDRRVESGDKALGSLIASCETPIKQLIARYDLAGKSVLSIGAGEGFEEVWFARAGCPLTLVDINPAIGAFCASLPPAAHEPDTFTYVIGDAADYVAKTTEFFDVLYVSSFHPDELRREKLHGPRMRWPIGEDPYHSTLMRTASLLRRGGIAIFQHYRGGVNIAVQYRYLSDVKRQFARHELAPLEVYAFHSSPAHLLVVATKDSKEGNIQYAGLLEHRIPIGEFHGRLSSVERQHVIQVYKSSGSPMSTYLRLAIWRTRHTGNALKKAVRRQFLEPLDHTQNIR